MQEIKKTLCTIAICTYRRPNYLRICLESLVEDWELSFPLKILVVDNACDKATAAVVKDFQDKVPVSYAEEPSIGLSLARNRAVMMTSTHWICFLDDDALVRKGFLKCLLANISKSDFDAFGGMFYPWYDQDKPKWLPSWFGMFRLHYIKERRLLKEGEYFAGGICAFQTRQLEEIGLFPTEIGMRGGIIGYGEEDAVQMKLMEKGYRLGFDPEWEMDHLVADYKQKLGWHLQRSIAKGRDEQVLKGPLGLRKKGMLFVRAVLVMLVGLLTRWPLFIFRKDYFWQNYLLHALGHSLRMYGKITAGSNRNS